MIPQKKLGFGLMRLPLTDKSQEDSVNMDELCQMVDSFLAKGFTYFDTAYVYTNLKSEIFMREALVKRHPRQSFTVADKMPCFMFTDGSKLEAIFNEQLAKCGVEYFDYYLLHALNAESYENCCRWGCFDFLQEKKKQGLAKYVGISYHDTAEVLEKILQEQPELDFIQLQINYLDWDSPTLQSRRCLEVANKYHKPVVVMEPIKGGTLAKVPAQTAQAMQELNPQASPASWAIRFAASQPGVMVVLSGMSTLEQMQDNTSYMENFQPLQDKEREILKGCVKEINSAYTIPCTACHYCVSGCPKHIPIPTFFTLYNEDKQALNADFSIQENYYNAYAAKFNKASECIKCHQCEKHCPQHLPITEYLCQVAKHFEK